MFIPPIGRKAKDLRDLRTVNGVGGQMTIRSKNKITNPVNPSQTLGRRSTVTVTQRPSVTQDKPTVTPGAKSTTVTKIKKFEGGDMSEGRPIDRPTTPELGRSFNENPGKTRQRMDAQARKEKTYTTPSGKTEYSGRDKITYESKTTKAPDKVEPGKIRLSMNKSISVNPKNVGPIPRKRGGGGNGITLHRTAGVNNKGRGQNYMNLNIGGKKVIKWRTKTRGSK